MARDDKNYRFRSQRGSQIHGEVIRRGWRSEMVREGQHFDSAGYHELQTSGDQHLMLLRNPADSGTLVNVEELRVSTGGALKVDVYYSVNFTDAGVAKRVWNRRPASSNTAAAIYTRDPVATIPTDSPAENDVISAAGGSKTGGDFDTGSVYLDPGENVLQVMTARENSVSLSMSASWSEYLPTPAPEA